MKKLSYKEQLEFLDEAKKTGEPFSEILASHDCDYNSLVYSDEKQFSDFDFPHFSPLEERKKNDQKIPCVSFFSGAGGLDLGFKCAGFENIADIEINPTFCETLKMNGAKNVLNIDMQNVDLAIAELEKIGIEKKFAGVFHGGPPCQSFSVAANQRFSKSGENFKRTGFQHKKYGNLLFCYTQVILHFLPEVFLIENVEGLLTIDGGEQVAKVCSLLTTAGYEVAPPKIVNAADYGVPQKRMRTIIVGSRIGRFEYPKTESHIPAGSVFATPICDSESSVPRFHKAQSIERYMVLQFGGRDKMGRVDRIDPSLPSKTVIAGGTAGGGRSHLHPFIPRTMTVRECARLQTFPDDYVFTGPMARRFTQVGNAVPPVLAYKMALAIYRSIYEKQSGK